MDYISLLQSEMRPAFGCTEPIALAYAAAKAVSVLDEFPNHIHARCSANIIKNVKSVVIPNSGGRKGLSSAASDVYKRQVGICYRRRSQMAWYIA